MVGDTEMELASTCSTQWASFTPLIRPKISHLIYVIIANLT